MKGEEETSRPLERTRKQKWQSGDEEKISGTCENLKFVELESRSWRCRILRVLDVMPILYPW